MSYLFTTRSSSFSVNVFQNVINKIINEIKTIDFLTSYSLAMMSLSVAIVSLLGYYYEWKLGKKFDEMNAALEAMNQKACKKEVQQSFLAHALDLSLRSEGSMNMAMYMSEMRKKSKKRRPSRPRKIEDRATELLPAMKVERCERDGVSVLDIDDGNRLQDIEEEETNCETVRHEPQPAAHLGDAPSAKIRPEAEEALVRETSDGDKQRDVEKEVVECQHPERKPLRSSTDLEHPVSQPDTPRPRKRVILNKF